MYTSSLTLSDATSLSLSRVLFRSHGPRSRLFSFSRPANCACARLMTSLEENAHNCLYCVWHFFFQRAVHKRGICALVSRVRIHEACVACNSLSGFSIGVQLLCTSCTCAMHDGLITRALRCVRGFFFCLVLKCVFLARNQIAHPNYKFKRA